MLCRQPVFSSCLRPSPSFLLFRLDSAGHVWEGFTCRCREQCLHWGRGRAPLNPPTSINTVVVNLLKTWIDLRWVFFPSVSVQSQCGTMIVTIFHRIIEYLELEGIHKACRVQLREAGVVCSYVCV